MNKYDLNEAQPIRTDEYHAFREYLRKVCGIDLGVNKQYLVSTRVRRILLNNGLNSLGALTQAIQEDSNRHLRQQVIDAMTTNETFWFRDTYPFQYLASTLLPEFSKKRPKQPIKIWSAACSSGQEPYSISMIFEEACRNKFVCQINEGDILGTDLSSIILEQAKEGCYDRISLVRGLSSDRLHNFFDQVNDDTWQLKPSIRQRVRFRPINLQDSYLLLGRFDIVFCRNVLIYFSAELKLEILKKIHASLTPGGYLFLGSSESITGLNDYFEMVNCNPGIAYRAKAFRP